MRKLLTILLCTFLTCGLFLACSNSSPLVKEEANQVASISFEETVVDTKALSVEYDGVSDPQNDVYWFYTAVKADSGTTTGKTGNSHAVGDGYANLRAVVPAENADGSKNYGTSTAKGLAGHEVSPFSVGEWTFRLYGFTSTTPSAANMVYDTPYTGDKAGAKGTVLPSRISKVTVGVEPKVPTGEGVPTKGKLIIKKLSSDTGSVAPKYYCKLTGETAWTALSSAVTGDTGDTLEKNSGDYILTIGVFFDSTETSTRPLSDTPDLEGSIAIAIYPNGEIGSSGTTLKYKTIVSGKIDDLTGGVEFDEEVGKRFIVTYDANGANSGTAPVDTNSYKKGESVTLKTNEGDLAKNGLVFAGWNTKADGTGTTYAAGATNAFTITEDMTLYAKWAEGKKKVGGKIFYVDDSATGATYKFYDGNGSEITDWADASDKVTALQNADTYEVVSGTVNKDKFYVADSTNGLKKYNGTSYYVWATSSEDLSSASGIEVLSNESGSAIGKGKTNTAWIFTNKKNNATYFPNGAQVEVSGETFNAYSCWDFCKACNENEVNGCNDWFIPSIAECAKLRESGIWGSSANDWLDNTKYNKNMYSALWSSSANSDNSQSWYWYATSSSSLAQSYNRNDKSNVLYLAVIRAF